MGMRAMQLLGQFIYLFSLDVTIFKKVIEMLRSRRGQETEKPILEAKVKIQ